VFWRSFCAYWLFCISSGKLSKSVMRSSWLRLVQPVHVHVLGRLFWIHCAGTCMLAILERVCLPNERVTTFWGSAFLAPVPSCGSCLRRRPRPVEATGDPFNRGTRWVGRHYASSCGWQVRWRLKGPLRWHCASSYCGVRSVTAQMGMDGRLRPTQRLNSPVGLEHVSKHQEARLRAQTMVEGICHRSSLWLLRLSYLSTDTHSLSTRTIGRRSSSCTLDRSTTGLAFCFLQPNTARRRSGILICPP